MKKALLIFAGIFAFILLALAVLPIIFKDKILERVDQELAATVNAQLYYDYDNISLSFFRRFPHVSASIQEFGIVGNPPFQYDTLVHINRLQVDFNVWSVIFADYPELKGVHLDGGSLYVRVLEDGQANYDITFPSEEPTTESNFQIGIDLIEVNDFNLIYDDRQLDFFMALAQIEMEGKGNFTSDVYDLPLKLETRIADVTYEGTSYLSNKIFKGDTEMHIDMNSMKFSFGDGDFALNDFNFDLDGYIAMPEDPITFDLEFKGQDNTFRSILSLLPGMYTENFSNLRTSGTMDFHGFFRGIYDEDRFPAFDIMLQVEDGMFQYPDLPRPVSDIFVDMHVVNETDNLDNTSINIPVFKMNFGNNPVSGRLALANLVTYDIDGALSGKINLEELTSIFPIENLTLRGALDINAVAQGRYDSITEIIPTIDAKVILANGYIKSAEYPAPIENLNVNTTIQNNTGRMNDFIVNLSQFGFILEGEEVSGRLRVNDFAKLNWDAALKGTVDVGKMLAIFPMEGIIMEGKILADIDSKGSYEDVEAERFNRLDTRGTMQVRDFYFTSNDLPQGVRIHQASAAFTPERINLTAFDSRIGQSPVQATGFLSNYLNYVLKENESLKGQLNLNSSRFNVNEWMVTSDTQDTTALSVIELPKNIDFTMNVAANRVVYDNLTLDDVKGSLTLQNGILGFRDASMRALGGLIVMNGSYNPTDITAPAFDFKLKLENLSIPKAFESFNTVQALMPVARHMNGNFNTTLDFSGLLGADMMPILSSLDGSGIIRVVEAAFENSSLLQGITSLTKLRDTNTIQFRNVAIPIAINDGVMDVKPFDVRLWDYQANIQGSTGFDGTINYLINMDVPAAQFGSQANNLLSAISGTPASGSTVIPLAINMTGSYNSPRFGLAGGNSIEALLTNALRSRVDSERENLQEQATQQFKAAEDSIKRELKTRAEVAQDSAKREAERRVEETKSKVVDEAKGAVRGLLQRPRPPVRQDTTQIQNQ